MIVLGLNGFRDRTHDPAAALVVDGELVAFVEQERLSRRKHGVGEYPHAAVRAVLDLGGVRPAQVDRIGYGWDLELFNRHRGRNLGLDFNDAVELIAGFSPSSGQRVEWVDHHLAHAASAFFGSGFQEAVVVVVDAEGETGSASIYAARNGRLTRLREFDRRGSLGLMFRAAAIFCGFGAFGAGEVMGLAPYGSASGDPAVWWEADDITTAAPAAADEDQIVEGWLGWFESRYGTRAKPDRHAPWSSRHPAVARLVQDSAESVMMPLVEHACQLAGSRNLCLAGGVALNCVINGRLSSLVDALYIPPAPHDAGVAAGAAFWLAAESGETIRPWVRADLGPEFDEVAIDEALAASGWTVRSVDDPAAAAAELLADGNVIGWFHGRMEAGPRALGQRSILALPSPEALRDRTNDIKDRQRWRPLAPALRVEETARWFDGAGRSPYMLLSYPMTREALAELPAVAHVDGTARPQTVSADGSRLRALLDAVADRSGKGVVLNTSFNGPGEPIVCSPQDALRTFASSGLDALVIGHRVVRRSGGAVR